MSRDESEVPLSVAVSEWHHATRLKDVSNNLQAMQEMVFGLAKDIVTFQMAMQSARRPMAIMRERAGIMEHHHDLL